ncbi:LysR substrate-binding domain-containing protein [Amycolatopsis sp. NPDC005961]|uniref:LysR substrate-binding domain-containing protein n=1 Tax=Amycolatopsis sp. NPDC005961 TaxID=3156720 RepID=UPI0033D97292
MPATTAPDGGVLTKPVVGIHGSPGVALRVLRAAGWDEDDVHLSPYDVRDPFRALRAGEQHVMIVKYEVREPDLAVSRPLVEDARAVLVGRHHALAARTSVTLDDVAGYPAFRCPEHFPPDVWDRVVPPRTPAGRVIDRVHPMTTVDDMVRILAATDAVHVSFASLASVVPQGIAVIPVRDLPPAPVALCWLRTTPLPAAVARLVADAEAGPR